MPFIQWQRLSLWLPYPNASCRISGRDKQCYSSGIGRSCIYCRYPKFIGYDIYRDHHGRYLTHYAGSGYLPYYGFQHRFLRSGYDRRTGEWEKRQKNSAYPFDVQCGRRGRLFADRCSFIIGKRWTSSRKRSLTWLTLRCVIIYIHWKP